MVNIRQMMMDIIESGFSYKTETTGNIKYKNNEEPFIAIYASYRLLFTINDYNFELNKKLLKETDIIMYIRKNKYNKNHKLIFSYNGKAYTFKFGYKHSYKKLFRKLKRYSKSYKIVKSNNPYIS